MNLQIIARRVAVILILGIAAVISGYFSLFLHIGTAVVVDPRDVLVVFAGVLTGPFGGVLVGVCAGFSGADPVVEIPMFVVSGLVTGLISHYCRTHNFWIPAAALGLGCGYVVAGLILMRLGWYEDLATFAFRSLIMIHLCILILFIIDSLDPGILNWEKRMELADRHTEEKRSDFPVE